MNSLVCTQRRKDPRRLAARAEVSSEFYGPIGRRDVDSPPPRIVRPLLGVAFFAKVSLASREIAPFRVSARAREIKIKTHGAVALVARFAARYFFLSVASTLNPERESDLARRCAFTPRLALIASADINKFETNRPEEVSHIRRGRSAKRTGFAERATQVQVDPREEALGKKHMEFSKMSNARARTRTHTYTHSCVGETKYIHSIMCAKFAKKKERKKGKNEVAKFREGHSAKGHSACVRFFSPAEHQLDSAMRNR